MKNGRFSTQSFLTISILLLSASVTFGKTITVGIGLGYDYSSIQPAINAALYGDTIEVAQGTYEGQVRFNGKKLILTSKDPNAWNMTIIKYHDDSVITFTGQENENCILQGFTICDGRASYGGGINGNGTKATIRKCKIDDNRSEIQGGGLYNCDGLIEDCIISNNDTYIINIFSKGGGLYGCDGTIKNCIIRENAAGGHSNSYPGEGGGLYNCNGAIIGCTIENNTSKGNGGGLYYCNDIIRDCLIKNNIAEYNNTPCSGGGLYNCNADINNCTIQNNSASDNGGGLSVCIGQISNCIIQNNTATNKGGGLYGCNGIIKGCTIKTNTSSNDSGGGLANCMGFIKNCTIQGNTSPLWHAGGAIDCNSFKNCIITGNSARGYGGGLYNCKKVSNCKISGNSSEIYPGGGLSDCNSVINSIISGNAAGGNGAGLYNCNNIINCTIVGNYSQKKAGAVYFKGNYGIIDNTIIWGNLAIEGGQVLVESIVRDTTALWNLSIDYSDIQGGPNSVIVSELAALRWEPNNIDINPLFKQSGSWTLLHGGQSVWNEGDYHLLAGSPCIDAGDPNRSYADQNDIDNGGRLFGQYVDIGADEYVYIPPVFVQLELAGPQQVNEGDTAQYTAVGRYDDNSEVNLNDEVTWSLEPNNIGTIDANGLFIPGELDETTVVTIKATYTPVEQEITYIAQIIVSCIPLPGPTTTYYVDTATGSNENDGLSRQTAFKTIQRGIDASQDGNTVLVYPGLYREAVILWGKNITLKSAEGAAVIENPDSIAVLFCFEETSQCKLQNFIIKNSKIGILCVLNSSPTIENLTIVNNNYGIECFNSEPVISNCIFWYNTVKDFINCLPTYSCTEDTYATLFDSIDLNIHSNPFFADPNAGDYHLKSEGGRYSPPLSTWVLDNVTSPCIDAGNPEDDFSNEPQPNGDRINMGAYGNTPQASKSMPPDISGKASQPSPANGAINVAIRPALIWNAGSNAKQHDIYLGTSLNNVNNATRDNPLGVLVSKGQNSTSFTPAGNLNYYKVYFWRVDEIGSSGSITKGDVWTFTTDSGGKGRSCFPADTPVWVDGRMVEISKVVTGQIVGKADCAMPTSGTIKGLEEHGAGVNPCYEMTLESGNSITIVHSHYFMTISGEWKKIEELSAGMQLQTMNGPITIKSVMKKEIPFLGASYNLMLYGSEQYFVGKDGIAALDCSKKTWEMLEEARK